MNLNLPKVSRGYLAKKKTNFGLMKLKYLIRFMILALFSKGQQVPALMKDLKSLFAQADTINPFKDNNNSEIIDSLNQAIYDKLSEILLQPSIKNYKIDSILSIKSLGLVYSPDKRLWIFNWYENTGGSFKSNISLLYYITSNGTGKIGSGLMQNGNSTGPNVFESNGAWFSKIYKLNNKSKKLYLCMSSVQGCNTCCAESAMLIELTKDSINFCYPGFVQSDNFFSNFIVDSRCGDIKTFEFDPKTNTLSYSYQPDDNTPVKADNSSQKPRTISGKFKFDGTKFSKIK